MSAIGRFHRTFERPYCLAIPVGSTLPARNGKKLWGGTVKFWLGSDESCRSQSAIHDGGSHGWHSSACYSDGRFWQNLSGPVPSGHLRPWHVTLPVHGRFARLPLRGSCRTKRLRLARGTWWINSASFALLCNQKKAEARRSQQAKRVNTPFRPLTGTIEIGRSDRH
jgi:hypothetical protein